MYKARLGGALSVLLALGLLGPIAAEAQTTVTSREINFELLAVDGNKLVVRDQNGTRELTVPQDFRFLVDGKSLGVSDLHAGMKGTATVSTTTIAAAGLRHDHQARYRDLPDRTLAPDQGG